MDKRKLSELEKLRLKDRGDMVRRQKRKELDTLRLRNQPDRGDIVRSKFLKPDDKFRLSQPEQKNPENKEEHEVELVSQSTYTYPEELGSPKLPRRIEATEKQPELKCVEYRKRIRDRYTLKPKVKAVDVKKEVLIIKEELPMSKKSSSEPKERAKSKESLETRLTKSDKTRTDKTSVSKAPVIRRKPIIKTITAKNDSLKVYKAVTFVDQKKPKPLQIKIPSEVRKVRSKPKLPKKDAHIQIAQSKASVEKVAKKRKVLKKRNAKDIFRNFPTPVVSSAKILSPETEVAKWNSSNNHTMPYYEAWVNTTLAAISKYTKKDKLFLEKQNIMQTFKRQLQQRQFSPELMYDKFDDERYTGKIKVRQGLRIRS